MLFSDKFDLSEAHSSLRRKVKYPTVLITISILFDNKYKAYFEHCLCTLPTRNNAFFDYF